MSCQQKTCWRILSISVYHSQVLPGSSLVCFMRINPRNGNLVWLSRKDLELQVLEYSQEQTESLVLNMDLAISKSYLKLLTKVAYFLFANRMAQSTSRFLKTECDERY